MKAYVLKLCRMAYNIIWCTCHVMIVVHYLLLLRTAIVKQLRDKKMDTGHIETEVERHIQGGMKFRGHTLCFGSIKVMTTHT